MPRTTVLAVAATLAAASFAAHSRQVASGAADSPPNAVHTATPIKHLVVIYDENVSFDHYFATYPKALNRKGEPRFVAAADTPTDINTLAHAHLLKHNPNAVNPRNGAGGVNPFRLDRTQAATADQDHGYTAEQRAYDHGAADLFPAFTGNGTRDGTGAFGTKGLVMGYYDGNTVTAVWNLAQHFAMSDNAYTDTYGPSTPGALEAVSGQTNGAQTVASTSHADYVSNADGSLTIIGDVDPAHDLCSNPKNQVLMAGRNIGNLLNAAGVTWGSFMGGFDLGRKNPNGSTGCGRSTYSKIVHATVTDYMPHHAWFQYYPSTANPKHLRPSSVARIGYSTTANGRTRDPANHEYGLRDFYRAVKAGDFPSVSYLKAPAFEDGHAGYSDPLDEQTFIVHVVNFLEQQPDWKSTAVILTWDDSDGWYDHAFAKPEHASFDPHADQLDGPGVCGVDVARPAGLSGAPVNGRCGPGTRIPFLVISQWAKVNYVDHDRISQASIVRFIEDNWLHGERLGSGSFDAGAGSLMGMFDFAGHGDAPRIYLDPHTGVVLRKPPG